MTDFTDFAYVLLSGQTFKGVVLGGMLVSFLFPAILELLIWRRR